MNQKSFNSSIQKVSAVVLALALVAVGNGAHAAVPLNTPTGGYLICVNTKTTVATYPAKKKCPKGFKKLILGATGSTGKDGRTFWNGVKDPDVSVGEPGDIFLNTTTKVLFGPKDLITGWASGFSLVGPQGPGGTGPAGAPGANATLTCAQGGTCVAGNTGPGGGIVFYVSTTPNTAATPWRYMEAAPNTWSRGIADPAMQWCSVTSFPVALLTSGDKTSIHTLTTIGSGFSNSKMMLGSCTYGPANMAASYNGGGKTDWFIPSTDELIALYAMKTTVGGFREGLYWTSSEVDGGAAEFRFFFGDGGGNDVKSKSDVYVRPIRAF